MRSFENKVVWITGASSGIGEALACKFSQEGAKVILSSRKKAALENVAERCAGNTVIQTLDYEKPEQFRAISAQLVKDHGQIDILINNGGISQRSLAKDTDLSVIRKIMEIDFFGQVALTKAVMPHMLERKSGHLVAVSSITGKFGFPLRSGYAAAKHALAGFYETLYFELQSGGINVTTIFPGRIKTNISLNAIDGKGNAHGQMDEGQAGGISAEKCANIISKAILKRKKEVYPGGNEILMVYFKRFLPGLFNRIASNIKPT